MPTSIARSWSTTPRPRPPHRRWRWPKPAAADDVWSAGLAVPVGSAQAARGRRNAGPLLELFPRLRARAHWRGDTDRRQHVPAGLGAEPDGPGGGLLPGALARHLLVHRREPAGDR